jgi:hypothetical protein
MKFETFTNFLPDGSGKHYCRKEVKLPYYKVETCSKFYNNIKRVRHITTFDFNLTQQYLLITRCVEGYKIIN